MIREIRIGQRFAVAGAPFRVVRVQSRPQTGLEVAARPEVTEPGSGRPRITGAAVSFAAAFLESAAVEWLPAALVD